MCRLIFSSSALAANLVAVACGVRLRPTGENWGSGMLLGP